MAITIDVANYRFILNPGSYEVTEWADGNNSIEFPADVELYETGWTAAGKLRSATRNVRGGAVKLRLIPGGKDANFINSLRNRIDSGTRYKFSATGIDTLNNTRDVMSNGILQMLPFGQTRGNALPDAYEVTFMFETIVRETSLERAL